MTKAIAVQLFLMTIPALLANLSKCARLHSQQTFFQTPLSVRLLMPPFLIGNTSAIPEEIAIPVFASTDAAVVHFNGANRPLHVVVGARKAGKVVTLDQSGSQMGEP